MDSASRRVGADHDRDHDGKDRDAALAAGTLAYILSDWVDENFTLPGADLVDLKAKHPS
jgi:hypothetical protein